MTELKTSGHHPLYRALSGIVGSKYVTDEDFMVFSYSREMSPMPPRIQGIVVRPGSVEECVDIVKLANQTLTPIVPSGGRASVYGMPLGSPGRAIVVDMKRMNKIISIDEANICSTAQAGINTAEWQTQLEDKGWSIHTAYQPWYSDTIGGILSGASGAGAAYLMSSVGWNVNGYVNSIKVILGNGDVVETAATGNLGKRVPFAYEVGGPCTTPMFIGDGGAFGLKVEATYRMFYIKDMPPRAAEPAYFPTEKDIFDCYRDACRLCPFPSDQFALMPPYAVRTAMMCPEGWMLINCFGGATQGEIDAKRKWWYDIVKKHNGTISDNPSVRNVAEELASGRKWREMGEFATGGRYYLNEVMCSLGDVQECFNTMSNLLFKRYEEAGITTRVSICALAMGTNQHCCSYIVWYNDDDPKESKVALDVFQEMFEVSTRNGWPADLTQGLGARLMAKYWAPGYANYMKLLKKSLDPNNIMNPGVWGDVV
jgi:FAD/FMN-containing dehydrogenase